ncbi:MAG: hypothetical protein ACJAW3_001268 [Lentimonas sp.]|jgi:hypothetical protein
MPICFYKNVVDGEWQFLVKPEILRNPDDAKDVEEKDAAAIIIKDLFPTSWTRSFLRKAQVNEGSFRVDSDVEFRKFLTGNQNDEALENKAKMLEVQKAQIELLLKYEPKLKERIEVLKNRIDELNFIRAANDLKYQIENGFTVDSDNSKLSCNYSSGAIKNPIGTKFKSFSEEYKVLRTLINNKNSDPKVIKKQQDRVSFFSSDIDFDVQGSKSKKILQKYSLLFTDVGQVIFCELRALSKAKIAEAENVIDSKVKEEQNPPLKPPKPPKRSSVVVPKSEIEAVIVPSTEPSKTQNLIPAAEASIVPDSAPEPKHWFGFLSIEMQKKIVIGALKVNKPDNLFVKRKEEFLKSQASEIIPQKAYNGLGADVEVVVMGNGKKALKVMKDHIGSRGLEDKFITDVFDKKGAQSTSINNLIAEGGLKGVAEFFHKKGNVKFTVCDENGKTELKNLERGEFCRKEKLDFNNANHTIADVGGLDHYKNLLPKEVEKTSSSIAF